MDHKKFFTNRLLLWNKQENIRQMPWKGEKEPYKIWISEIILQQTRVQQGLEYYKSFIKKYPSVHAIAKAPESNVYKLWEGLGYYTRCKNIIVTAKYISRELNGVFPDKFEEIIKLKGIGPYTASAIASFAFNLPYAVVDGNVFRVLSRFFGSKIPVDSTEGKFFYSHLANELLDKKAPSIYNQAIMDFGAVICKPLPLCLTCPLHSKCIAYQKDLVAILPVKEKSMIRTARWMYFLLIQYENKFYIRKRTGKDIWQNLHEFVLIETLKPVSVSKLQSSKAFKTILGTSSFEVNDISKVYKQQLTHQTISGQFLRIKVKEEISIKGYKLADEKTLNQLAFPKFITAYMKE